MRKEESAHWGQKIRTDSGPDKSSHDVNNDQALLGRTMKGGPTDLSRTMKVGAYNDEKGGRGTDS